MNLLQMAFGLGLATTIAEDERKKRVRNIIEIPDNATNGDVIKAMFPYAKEIKGRTTIYYSFFPFGKMEFLLDWWNAPYKKESENEE